MNELFNIEESKSPRMKWMERHQLKVRFNPANVPDRRFEAVHGMTVIAYGANDDEALVNAAKSLNIRLWNEQ